MLSDLIVYTPMYIALFWTILLLSTFRQNNKAKYSLGIFMVVALFLYLSHAVYFSNHRAVYLFFDPLYNFASLAAYPLFFWYIKLLTIETSYRWKNLFLILPAFIIGLATAIVYMLMSDDLRQEYISGFLYKEAEVGAVNQLVKIQKLVYYVGRIIFAIQIVYYLIFGSRLVVRYNENVANFYSNLESKTVVWAKLLLYSFVFAAAIGFLFNILGRNVFIDSEFLMLIPSTLFSLLLFMIGYMGNMQNYTVVDLETDKNQQIDYEVKKVNQERLKDDLVELFKSEQLYKQNDLKITQVAARLNTNRTYVSNIINNDFLCSFSEFVNQYRISEAKEILTDGSSQNFSLEHVSEIVGFGSLHSFIRVFKQAEGITPGRFRNGNKIIN